MSNLICSLCFNELDDSQAVTTKECSCKVKYHEYCLNDLNNNGWDCPICRKLNDNHYTKNNFINQNDVPLDFFCNMFVRNPHFATFVIYFITSIIITFVYVIPYVIYVVISNYVKEKIIMFRDDFIVLKELLSLICVF
jgi:hypothetical protein